MVAIRARYVNGHLVPLTPIQTLQEGDVVEIYLSDVNQERPKRVAEIMATGS